MSEDKKPNSIFQGAIDAINRGKKKTPTMTASAQFTPNTKSSDLIDKDANSTEVIQQQYLDWQVNKISHNLYTRSIYFDTDRISAYQDFRAMDMSPEIAAALNIIRDECVIFSTIIPLMNGKRLTVEELYQQDYKNFEVYSFNPEKQLYEPALCERVVYKGEQDVYKITFDDDSYVEATSEHLWLKKGINEYAKTCELKEGMSIEPFYIRISDENDRINGYEMILENGKWEYTHRIVKRTFWPDKKGVCHHKDINKLNNESPNIEIMDWYEHQSLHNALNSDRWKNDKNYSEKMKKVFSETNSKEGPYWSNEEWRKERVGRMSEIHRDRLKNFTEGELKEKFSFPGELNPMYNNGYKLVGEKNGRFLSEVRREFSQEEIIEAFKVSFDIQDVCRLLKTKRRILNKSKSYAEIGFKNLIPLLKKRNKNEFKYLDIKLIESECEKYLGKIILSTQPAMTLIADNLGWTSTEIKICLANNGFKLWKDFSKQYNSEEALLNNIKKIFILNQHKDLRVLCEDENISINVAKKTIKESKYKNLTGLLQTANHKVKSVEYSGKKRTYDLVNVGEHHNFAILTSNGTGVISHNCLTRSEYNDILSIYSENERVKDILKDLFRNRLNVEYNLKLWIRDLIKYGDYFVYLEIDKEDGIYNFLSLPVEEVHREEGFDGKPDNVRFRWETMGMYFEDWQVAHFRMIEDTKKLPYGRSILDPARKLWKQLQLAEDSMLVYRMCLEGNTRIKTNDGYKYIKDIQPGDVVVSYNKDGKLEYSKVVYHVNNGNKKLLKIKSRHNEILCTETHPILVNTNGLIHYVDAKDLKVGIDKLINVRSDDFDIEEKSVKRIYKEKFAKLKSEYRDKFKREKNINKSNLFISIGELKKYSPERIKQFAYSKGKAIPFEIAADFCEKIGFDFEDSVEILNKGENNSERINLPEYVTEEFSRLLGFIVGDGSVRKNSIGFTGGENEEVNKYYFNLLKKYFGEVNFNLDKRSDIGIGFYCVNNTVAADVMIDLGISDNHNIIRIPKWVFKLPHNKRKAFVLGISDADGSERCTKKGTWFSTIELSNKKLVEDIKELWHSIGLSSGHLKERVRPGGHILEGRIMPSSTSYSVTISELELDKYENVISIEEFGEDDVYDISVDNDLHNFIANGIPVHNTRAPERRVFYIEVGNLGDTDVQTYMMKIQNQLKKQPVVDSRNGQYNLKYDPMNITEDFFIPIRGDKSSKIETLPGACLALNTKIMLLDGRSLDLGEIIKEWDNGNKNLWAYSINPSTGEVVPGRISWAGITRKNTDVVKITLDNGETITCTPDHKFNVRGVGIKEAKDLLVDESLWSFNTKLKKIDKRPKSKEYEMIFDHHKKEWVYTHRMVANYFDKNYFDDNIIKEMIYDIDFLYSEKYTIHHKDFNRFNNSPFNLVKMNKKDHILLHSSVNENKNTWENLSFDEVQKRKELLSKMMSENNVKLWKNKDYQISMSNKRQALWKNDEYSQKTLSAQLKYVNSFQKVEFSEKLHKIIIEVSKKSKTTNELLSLLNLNKDFIETYNDDRKNIYKFKKVNNIKRRGLDNIIRFFNYSGVVDLREKSEYFNHKIVSVEFLSEKQDTGTITIDGNELYHNFHNFALESGVFTQNSNMGDIQDIEYLQNKLFASLQVPKAYLNYAENLPGGSTLSQADLRFSRTINSIQEVVILELRRIANIHLYFAGFTDEIDNFTLTLTNPSTQQELLKLETMKARMEVFKEMYTSESNSPVSYTWAMENILGFSKADIKLILKQKKVEKKIFAEIDSAVETYKKIGLFKELDSKYELPGAGGGAPAAGGGEGGDAAGGGAGGGAGEMGNLDLGSQLGGMDAGGGAAPEAAAGGGESPAPEAPLAENKIKRISKKSDDYSESLMFDLLGDTSALPTIKEREEKENTLLNKNNKMNYKVKKLIDSIQSGLDDNKREESKQGEKLLKEQKNKNTLFEKGNEIINKTHDMFSTMESMFSGNIEDIKDYNIINEEFIEEEEVEHIENLEENLEESESKEIDSEEGLDLLKDDDK